MLSGRWNTRGLVTRRRKANRDGHGSPTRTALFMPDGETALNSHVVPLWWIVHTRQNPHLLRASIEEALRDATGGLPVAHVRTMAEVEVRNTARQRFNMLMLSIFGAAGLLMAMLICSGLFASADSS